MRIKVLLLSLYLLVSCESNDLHPTSSFTRIFFSTSISDNNRTIGSTIVWFFKLNYSGMNYEHVDSHLKTDSIFTDTSVLGPNLITLSFTNGFYEARIDSTNVPNGSYENLEFKIKPCQWPDPIQGMHGKSIEFGGSLLGTQFEYWHNGDVNVKTYFPDSLLTIANGKPVKLQLYF